MDALTPVETHDFHTIREIPDYASHLYIGQVWKPDREIYLIGATMGLLCFTTNRVELYLSISRKPQLAPEGYFRGLKTDSLFYAQRDQRREPSSPQDLLRDVFLPAGSGFYVAKDEPIYFKCGAMNKSGRKILYDIFATVYWVEIMATQYRPQPIVDSWELGAG